MNKLLANIGIIAITVSSVLGLPSTPGQPVLCGTPNPGSSSSNCNPCGPTSTVQNLFSPQASPSCQVKNCGVDPGANVNGWICESCQNSNQVSIYGVGNIFFDGSNCVASCPEGTSPDKYHNCVSTVGDMVSCGTQASGNCNKCGINSLFLYLYSNSCAVLNCTVDPGANLNGWMCKSCFGFSGAHSVYAGGQVSQGGVCVSSCSQGYVLDVNKICQNFSGASVACGTASTGSNPSTNCNGCGANTTVQTLFQPATTPNCKVADCSANPASNLNGWMCKSCNGASGAHSAYANGKYLQGGVCVSSCTGGYVSDATNTCQAASGADVNCGTTGNAGGNSSNCNGCGANNTIQGLFTPSGTPNCKVTDCSANPASNLNGWMCKSCNGASGAHSAYANGKYLQGGVCVSSCTGGQVSDATNTCQAASGADVNCGTAGNAGGNSSNCNGCGANNTIQGLFTPSGTPNCKVTDCSANPASNLNGWMCKSCNGASGAHAVYANGKYLQGGVCVSSCTGGYVSDATNTCQAASGADVNCGTAGNAGGNSSNCNGCGANNTIQGLFSPSGTPNCKVTDCSANPASNLNGWMCKSCNGAFGAHSAYSAGKLLSGNTCVVSCSSGQTADANNVCQTDANNVQTANNSKSSAAFLALAYTILLLCVFF